MSENEVAPGLKNPEHSNSYLHLKPDDWTEERWRRAVNVVTHAALVSFFNSNGGGPELANAVVSNTSGVTVEQMHDAIVAAGHMEEASWIDGALEGRASHG